jgi:hypothetical protein
MLASSGGESDVSKDRLDECVKLLEKQGIKVVAFDMDLTAVAEHSRGRLTRANLSAYLSKATAAFLTLVPKLYEHGFGLAIATHSDEAEFGESVQPATHILGKELATALVQRHFDNAISSSFFIVAYNPRVHPLDDVQSNTAKRHHMRRLREHFLVKPEEILFFDDTSDIISDCRDHCGVRAFHIDPTLGFRLEDLLLSLR